MSGNRKLGRTTSHRKLMLRGLVTYLFENGKIETTYTRAKEVAAIADQMENLDAIVNYPGSYIIARYMKFAFLEAVNDGADPVEALRNYVDAINAEITRKREEFKSDKFDLWIDNGTEGTEPPMKDVD